MNIDLFLTPQNEGGLVCAGSFPAGLIGIIFDAETNELTLEFKGHDTLHLNVPLEEGHSEKILFAQRLHVGYFEGRMLTDAYEVPLYYLNDPYGGDFGKNASLPAPRRAVLAFEGFLKRCSFAQALHRDDLGNEAEARSVLSGIDPQALVFAPTLLRHIQMEAVVRKTAAPSVPPSFGLGGSSGTGSGRDALKSSRKDDTDKRNS